MIKIVTVCEPGFFFALAGQAIVEQSLITTFLKNPEVSIRFIMEKNPQDYERFTSHFQKEIKEGRVECWEQSSQKEPFYFKDVDIAILHGVGSLYKWVTFHRIMNKIPLFIHIHSLELSFQQRAMLNLPWKIWNTEYPVFFISPSSSNAQRLQIVQWLLALRKRKFPKIQIVPHGFDPSHLVNGSRQIGRNFLGLEETDKVILSLNRLTYQKLDYGQLVLAFHELYQKMNCPSNLKLALVGSASYEDETINEKTWVKLIHQLGLTKNVSIHYRIEEEIKKHIFAAADLYISIACNPQESFGIALLEAQAVGLPIVATDWNGYSEVLAEAYKPYLIPTIASNDIGRRMEWSESLALLTDAAAPLFNNIVDTCYLLLHNNAIKNELIQKGLEHVSRFTWQDTAQDLYRLWDIALNHKNDKEFNDLCTQANIKSKVRLSPNKSNRPETAKPFITSTVDRLATQYLDNNHLLSLRAVNYQLYLADYLKHPLYSNLSTIITIILPILTTRTVKFNELFGSLDIDYTTYCKIIILLIRRGVIEIVEE